MPATPQDGLDYPLLLQHLDDARTRFDVDWLAECESTNTVLLERAARGAPSGSVLVTDRQTAGRGRRGRRWLSSPDCSLTFSLLWRLPPAISSAGLSLAVGLAVAQALENLGIQGIGLKWPNDIWQHGRKLGGVLIEVAFDHEGLGLIIGIGLNLRRDPEWQHHLDQASAALGDDGAQFHREIVLGSVLRQLAKILDCFGKEGFTPLRDAWCVRNTLLGQAVRISSENGEHLGICGDVAADGALILHVNCGAHLLITSGDVSLAPIQT
ncbi:biotin--[acetyl-CoA-carboxylase] ligase [Uliginosibacterium sp. 31-16]|uniref:biotin--[acetyl-CoA-carboxylase] ligase n=1 Tax=Uliginosibacterium sp. 31-16 TaxID=3068315 RepID=UPI00273F9D6D|nr:biotin--[acetyl-CoA-carboxylase] ligase [Uliginosibacterium sp. 31-16]MDP5241135.1 biotin--[acetyl-CoA-carboxylase] ligase [Uliginosibacterium sp. 31-16]